MAEFQKVVKEYRRLCDATEYCLQCPLMKLVNGSVAYCEAGVLHSSEEAEDIIMQWATEHPIKTNGMKFREVFGEDMMAMLTGEHAPLDDWLDAEYKGGHGETD